MHSSSRTHFTSSPTLSLPLQSSLIVVIFRIGRIRSEFALVGLLFVRFRFRIADVPLRMFGRDSGRLLDVQLQVDLLVHSEVGIRPEADGEHVHAGPLGRGEFEGHLLAVHQVGDVVRCREKSARLSVADVRPPVFVFFLRGSSVVSLLIA